MSPPSSHPNELIIIFCVTFIVTSLILIQRKSAMYPFPQRPHYFLTAFIALIMTCFGLYGLWSEYHLMTISQPITVTIISASPQAHHTKHGLRYSANITYIYAVGSKQYQGDHVWPPAWPIPHLGLDDQHTGSLSWVNNILRQYPPGQLEAGYIDPHNPQNSFLLKGYNVLVIINSLVGIILLIVSLWQCGLIKFFLFRILQLFQGSPASQDLNGSGSMVITENTFDREDSPWHHESH